MESHLEKRFGLKGQTALVTGGTKGIGKAIVEDLAGCGAQVFTCARNQSDLDALIQDCTSRGLNVQVRKQ
jgi:Tropinone reductase 1